MSIFHAIFLNKLYGYEDAFGAVDCTTDEMKKAITEWFELFYQTAPTKDEDPCQRLPYAIVNKISKTCFGEYQPQGGDEYAQAILNAIGDIRKQAMQAVLIGGEAYLKPFPIGSRFTFSVVPRNNALIFGKDANGNPSDMGLSEKYIFGKSYYTLLERRTLGQDGLLTIQNKLFCSDRSDTIGRRVPLSCVPRYAQLQETYTYAEPVGLGLVRIKTPLANCIDGSEDGVSVYAAAAGLIHNINRNEALLNGEFERGQSRIIVSSDMLRRGNGGERELKDNVFVGLDHDPEEVGITVFSPSLREASFLERKTEYLRNVESLIGLKRGLLSQVESSEKTATEITSSSGDYNLTIIDFQQMWEKAVKEAAVLCGTLGRLHGVPGAHDIAPDDIAIDWGNGILYDENKTWTEYKSMVAAGLLKPEIAIGWYFNMPTETQSDLEKVRERYMPEITALMDGEA